ncbi:Stp1/IreP family PP2C-type Ser/Thr phosphatase [Chloroflexota bacterium]
MTELAVFSKTDIGRKRIVNEDSILTVKFGESHLLAIADGLGGHAAGEIASRLALEKIENNLKSQLNTTHKKDAIREAIADANAEIYRLSQQKPEYSGMGTTLVAAIVSKSEVLICNIGDSRAYLLGSEIRQISKDHSVVQELVDRNVISEEEAFAHAQKNLVTRTIGISKNTDPDFYEEEISGKQLLLCSDGLSDLLRNNEIFDIVTASSTLEKACTTLIDEANERGGKDNISVILASEQPLL